MTTLSDEQLRDWVARLQDGERGEEADRISRAIIQDFIVREMLGHEQSSITLNWLADALSAVIDLHANPWDALALLRRPRGHPANTDLSTNVAWWVRAAIEIKGYSEREAKELAADCFHCDIKTVERHRAKARTWAAGMNLDADWAAYFNSLDPPRPLPPLRDEN